MAEKLLLINPAKPPSKRRAKPKLATRSKKPMARTTRKRRTAAQRRATAKMVAANRRRRRTPARRKNPIRRRRPAYATTAPVRRRRRRSPAPIVRRRRRNPIVRKGMLDTLVFPAMTATGGALALDALWANLPIPMNIKAGAFKHVAKAGAAVALSWGAGKVVSKKTAEQIGMGALTVVFHQAAREFMSTKMPNIAMDGMGYMNPAIVAGRRDVPGMGYYPRNNGMGYYPPMPQPEPQTAAPVENEANFNYNG